MIIMIIMVVKLVIVYLRLKIYSMERMKNCYKKIIYIYNCWNIDQIYRISIFFIYKYYKIILIHIFLITKFCYNLLILKN